MKRLLLFLSFASLIVIANAQTYYPLVDTNSLWSTITSYQDQEPEANTYFTKFNEDTIINTYHYFKVFITYDSTLINWSNNGYIREDSNKKIYYTGDATQPEELLYDFNLVINDTITINSFSIKEKVDSINSINISGKPRKRFYLSAIHGAGDVWIEGIGSLLGVLNPQYALIVNGDGHGLLCYTENDTLKYIIPGYNSCYQLIDNVFEPEKNNVNFVIFPNPANDYFITQSQQQAEMEILTIQGQTIIRQLLQQGKTDIDISGLAKGVYILRLCSNDKTEVTKIVKE